MFMMFFLKQHQVDSALMYMEAALGHPKSESVDKVLKYFEEEKNVDGAEALCKMLKKVNCLDSKAYDSLLRTYIAAGKPAPDMRIRIEADGIEVNSEFENLLETVCPK
ncbi:Pentatricopeptide repeat-containing protein [Camellia lanceoleosa]|uniref:Pentatricopeptide repeat-containing protein n=1 Tax=Camellia lanceoleosa TaxID=1840588 RepID=A0ACC0G2T5_9ERIC|nr:Pentatricopeptide repeat-containing protein [Camellia lanceoleosa]